jgi:hypothetical protein
MAPRKKAIVIPTVEPPIEQALEQPDIEASTPPAPPAPSNATRQRSTTARSTPKGGGKDSGRKSGGGGKSFSSGGNLGTRVGKKRPKKSMKVKGMGAAGTLRYKPNKKKTTKRGASKKLYFGK